MCILFSFGSHERAREATGPAGRLMTFYRQIGNTSSRTSCDVIRAAKGLKKKKEKKKKKRETFRNSLGLPVSVDGCIIIVISFGGHCCRCVCVCGGGGGEGAGGVCVDAYKV